MAMSPAPSMLSQMSDFSPLGNMTKNHACGCDFPGEPTWTIEGKEGQLSQMKHTRQVQYPEGVCHLFMSMLFNTIPLMLNYTLL